MLYCNKKAAWIVQRKKLPAAVEQLSHVFKNF